jgi:hypothetical protein
MSSTAQHGDPARESQRVAGLMPAFDTTRDFHAPPLSPLQKLTLFLRSQTDPWPFLSAGMVAGISQAEGSYSEWSQGFRGYSRRYRAAYSDAFVSKLIGNAVLPIVLREDPRYFQRHTGPKGERFLWAAASVVWCKRDNGSWGPNYANLGGNMIGAAISRTYYPAADRTFGKTIDAGLMVSAERILGSEIAEFWPDIVVHVFHRHP